MSHLMSYPVSHPKRPIRILAIDPGTRQMGVVILDGRRLVHFGVSTFRGPRIPSLILKWAEGHLRELIDEHKPRVLVVEKSFIGRSRRASLLNVITDELMAIGRRRGLEIRSYAPSTVRKVICGHGSAGKERLARVVVRRYFPFLRPCLGWGKAYWQHMFDAVALGLVYQQHLEGKRSSSAA